MGKIINDVDSMLGYDGKFLDREPLKTEFWNKYTLVKNNIKNAKEKASKKEEVVSEACVIEFFGPGGIGKSSLLQELETDIKKGSKEHDKAKVIRYDFEDDIDGFKVIEVLSQKLKDDYKFDFSRLKKGLAAYYEIIGENGDKFKQKTYLERNPGAAAAVKVAECFPIIGSFASSFEAGDTIYTSHINKTDNNFEEELLIMKRLNNKNKQLEHLIVLFIKDLEENLQKEEKPLIIMFDAYEYLVNEMKGTGKPTSADEWIRGGVKFEKALIPNAHGVLWVIGGREELRWRNFDEGDWETSLKTCRLEGLPEGFSTEYFNNAGINDEQLCKDLYKLTEGMPIYMYFCVNRYYALIHKNIEPKIGKFGRTIANLVEHFTRDMDRDVKPIVQFLSCLNQWTDEMVTEIANKNNISKFDKILYNKIKKFSFINNIPPSKIYSMNRVVRDAILVDDDFDKEDKKVYEGYAIDFCKNKIEKLDISSSSNYLFYLKQLMEYALQYFEDNEELLSFYFENLDEKLQYLRSIGKTANLRVACNDFSERIKNVDNKLLRAKVYYTFGYIFIDEGEYSKALELLEEVIKVFKNNPDYKENYFRARLDKVSCLLKSGSDYEAYFEARNLCDECLTSKENVKELNFDLMFEIFYSFIDIEISLGDYEEADSIITNIMVLFLGTKDTYDSILLYGKWVPVLSGLGEYKKAINAGKLYRDFCVNQYGNDDPRTMIAKRNLAKAYLGDNNPKESLLLYEEIIDKQIEMYGKNHPNSIRLMGELTYLLMKSEKFPDALEWGEKALANQKERKDKNYYDTIEMMEFLVKIYDKLNMNDKKEKMENEIKEMYSTINKARAYYQENKYEDAFEWLNKAAEEGNLNAMYDLGNMYFYGIGVEKDYEKSFKWYKQAAEDKHIDAEFKLGLMYMSGYGIEENFYKACWWITKAAKHGESEAQFLLAKLYNDGEIPGGDKKDAIKWCRKAAEQGNEEAQALLDIICLSDDSDSTQNVEDEFGLLKCSAEQGDVDAEFSLGLMYYYGQGFEENNDEAFKWLKMAAEQGKREAQYLLAIMYSNGYGTEKDNDEALKWFKKAAEQGEREAQFELGRMYIKYGKGTQEDYKEGFRWTAAAAEQGHAWAQFNMGQWYYNGIIVEEDKEEAFKWFMKAAEQGECEAQFSLAIMFLNGEGVEKNEEEAIRWAKKAAEQGHESAKSFLGIS